MTEETTPTGRTVGYLIRDVSPTGDDGYLAKCRRCGWAGTFSRPDRAVAEEDLLRHLSACRGVHVERAFVTCSPPCKTGPR